MGDFSTSTKDYLSGDHTDETVIASLEHLLAVNGEIAKAKAVFPSERERLEAITMKRPLTLETAFAYLGLMLGSLGPLSIIFTMLIGASRLETEQLIFVGLALLATSVTAAVGFASGMVVGRAVFSLRDRSWPTYIVLSMLIGIAWGAVSGGLGGIFLFVIGGVLGAIIGAMAAAAVLPAFAVSHRLLARGGMMEFHHFLPIALGSVLTVCAFIIGRS